MSIISKRVIGVFEHNLSGRNKRVIDIRLSLSPLELYSLLNQVFEAAHQLE